MAEPTKRTLYGRRRGKPLRPGRQKVLNRHWPELAITPETVAGGAETVFGFSASALWLEIGFGAGEHLAAQAAAHPDIAFIGCEPFENGIARLVSFIEEQKLANIRILKDDAALLLRAMPPASVDRAFLLFPDPWPKRRHHKRRFVRAENMDLMARALKPGALWRIATDDMSYCRWILARMPQHPAFEWLVEGPDDWRRRAADWPETRYERKAIEQGRKPAYLTFRRREA